MLYARAISTYFDLQTGVRVDLDGGRGSTWYSIGVQGLAVQFFNVAVTAYVSDGGHSGAKSNASYDIPITNQLYLQPQAELNVYSKADRGRGIGSGLAELDAGIRLRDGFNRKFAPYVGAAFEKAFGRTASFTRRGDFSASAVRFIVGVRTWF